MFLDEILQANRGFVAGRAPKPIPPDVSARLAVLACYDPRLDRLLGPALGLDEGQAFLLRAAGALVRPGGDLLRSLALAVYVFGVSEVLVVGHTSCRMAGFETAPFIDAFRRRSVSREAFGADDLRSWAGAVRDPRDNVHASVKAIREAAFLPKDLRVAGLLLDDASGALHTVVGPGEAAAAPAAGPAESPGATPPATPPPAAEPAASARPAVPLPLVAVEPIREIVDLLQSRSGWREELRLVREDMARETNPLARFGLLEGFLRRTAQDSKEVADALDKVVHAGTFGGRRLSREGILELIHRVASGDKP